MKITTTELGTIKVSTLLISQAVPSIVGFMIMSLDNVTDAVFIGREAGTLAIAGISVAFPVQLVMVAIANALGKGGACCISRLLGENKKTEANYIFGNMMSVVLAFSTLAVMVSMLFLPQIFHLFWTTNAVRPYAEAYLSVILYGTIFFAFILVASNVIRAEGHPRVVMITMIVSTVLNVICTPIFIFCLNMGVKGAALASVVSQGLTAGYLFCYFLNGKSNMSFSLTYMRLRLKILKEIFSIGSPTFVRQVAGSVMFVVVNRTIMLYGNDMDVAVYGIINQIMSFALMPIIGLVQAMETIIGYNYGLKQFARVKETLSLSLKIATLMAMLVFTLMMIFPGGILKIFSNDPALIKSGTTVIRIIFIGTILAGMQLVGSGFYQALGKPRQSLLLTMSSEIITIVPLILILPYFFYLNGVWLSFPISDLLGSGLTMVFLIKERSRL